jgi:hypothetical protein
MPQSDTVLVDFLSHAEIAIGAGPDAVWPAIADTNGWHGTHLARAGGPRGEVGERFHASPPDHPDMIMLHLTNVELEPGRRRTIRIHTPDGQFSGYSSWTLTGDGASTIVAYDVFCLHPFPKEAVGDDLLAQAQAGNEEGLRRLKAFVEDARP